MLDASIEKNATAIDRGTAAVRADGRIADNRDFRGSGNAVPARGTGTTGRDRARGTGISPLNGLAFPEMPSILFNLQS
jgi:hypothetical protein